jgi:hypothetical protein
VRYISRFGNDAGWNEAAAEEKPEAYRCVGCGGLQVNVCLGFAGNEHHGGAKGKRKQEVPDAVLWFYVGVRCVKCGILGCFNDNKVGRGPMGEKTFREISGETPYQDE